MLHTPDVMLEHRIRQRAFELYETKRTGSAVEDWLQAEREVLKEAGASGVRVLSAGQIQEHRPK